MKLQRFRGMVWRKSEQYNKIRPLLYTFAILCIAAIVANQYINRRPKIYNNPWLVIDVMFGIKHYCTDGLGTYRRHLPEDRHEIGKKKTQKTEQKHIRLRTRIKRLQRKTICFSKTEEMPETRNWIIYQ